MARLCSPVILTTSFGLGALCRERREFDCVREIMGWETYFAGLRYLADWQVVLQNMASTRAQSKIELQKLPKGECPVNLVAWPFEKGSLPETPP